MAMRGAAGREAGSKRLRTRAIDPLVAALGKIAVESAASATRPSGDASANVAAAWQRFLECFIRTACRTARHCAVLDPSEAAIIDQIAPVLVAHDANLSPDEIGAILERLQAWSLSLSKTDDVRLRPSDRRRRAGIHFTPRPLAEALVKATLAPLVQVDAAPRLDSQSNLRRPSEIARLTICDPACGGGAFLLAAARELEATLSTAIAADPTDPFAEQIAREVDPPRALRRWIAGQMLFGADLDPLAVLLTRELLANFGALTADARDGLAAQIVCGESLLAIDWPRVFPTVYAELGSAGEASGGGFSAVVGNPPFINAIEHVPSAASKRALRLRYGSTLGGTADRSSYFLALADAITARSGTIGLVLPRTFLQAQAAEPLRAALLAHRPLREVWIPPHNGLFSAANVLVIAAVFQADAPHVTVHDNWNDPVPRHVPLATTDWWRELTRGAGDDRTSHGPAPLALTGNLHGPSTADRTSAVTAAEFQLFASMTAEIAYAIQPALRDDPSAHERRFITSGLIDPGVCLWGQKRCRYLKRDYLYPTISVAADLPGVANRRLAKVQRPKLLVAGVAGPGVRLELYLDERGGDVGAVSTYTIVHRDDDLAALRWLAEGLSSPLVAGKLMAELGASSMGSGLVTITKRFLASAISELA